MKSSVLGLAPVWAIESVRSMRSTLDWVRRGCTGFAPQFVKQRVLMKHAVPSAQWVETGTYLGTTTKFLARSSPMVHSIEPAKPLFERASERFRGRNVTMHFGTSEEVLPGLLTQLKGNINFWLDGHYSAGITFRSEKESPLLDELHAIEVNLPRFGDVAIFIDDIRCCVPPVEDRESGYPSLDELVAWARRNGFEWAIEQDIMVIWKICGARFCQ